MCPAHRHRPVRPLPQGFGAFAALERDDRAATFQRVPRCLPGNRGNKTRRAVQARGGVVHTTRHRRRLERRCGFTRYRSAAGTAAHGPQRNEAPPHMFPYRSRIGAISCAPVDCRVPFTRYRTARGGRAHVTVPQRRRSCMTRCASGCRARRRRRGSRSLAPAPCGCGGAPTGSIALRRCEVHAVPIEGRDAG